MPAETIYCLCIASFRFALVIASKLCVLQSEVHGADELVTFNMAKLNLGKPAVAGVSIASKLTIQVHIPQQESAQPSVKFLKQGALTDDELSVFSAALRAANKVTSLVDATQAAAPSLPVSPCHTSICPAHHQRLLTVFLHSPHSRSCLVT